MYKLSPSSTTSSFELDFRGDETKKNHKMMIVSQMSVYHTLMEAYNIMKHSSSEQIHMKWTNGHLLVIRNIL